MVDHLEDLEKLNKLSTLTPPQKMNQMIVDNFGKNFDLKKPKVIIVGLCGGQGGGKTKLSRILSKNIPNSAIIEERSYFKVLTSKRKLSYEIEPLFVEIGGYSKDRKLLLVELSDPNSYDYDKLYQNLKDLKEGKPISLRKFDEDSGSYIGEETTIKPKETSMVIMEGYFIFRDKKIRDLNKGCEKLIEEQKKYIHFYKNKKLHNNENFFTKDDNKKGMKSLGNMGEEKFELFNLGLYSQNLKEMNHELKEIINKKEIDSFAAFNLCS